jgi:hypothetical protein
LKFRSGVRPSRNRNVGVIERLRNLYQIENANKRFTETAQILQENPGLSEILLGLLIEQFAQLPDDVTTQASLVLNSLTTYKPVSFDRLFAVLLKYGRAFEMQRFLSVYNIAVEPLILRICEYCKIDQNMVPALLVRYEVQDIPIAKLLYHWPSLASTLYRQVRDLACPFILLILPKLTKENCDELRTKVSNTGSLLNFTLRGKMHFMDDPLFFLDQAKREGDWETAAQLASEVGLEDEHRLCRSKLRGDLGSKLIQPSLDVSEQHEILLQFVQEFENAGAKKTFEDYAVFARGIARRLDAEMRQVEVRRKDAAAIVGELMDKRTDLQSLRGNVSKNDRCTHCRKTLGAGSVFVFPCGHVFHAACKEEIERGLKQITLELRRSAKDIDQGCPTCGPLSAVLVHRSITRDGTESWALEL